MSLASSAVAAAKAAIPGLLQKAAKKAATQVLQKMLSMPPAPKPVLPPWHSLGKPPAPGSPAALKLAQVIKSQHAAANAPSGGAAGGGGTGPGGKGIPAAGKGGMTCTPGGSRGFPKDPAHPYGYNPRGEGATPEDAAAYFPNETLPADYMSRYDSEHPWYESILGGNMEDGYTAFFGMIELGSPKWPGAGTGDSTWLIPDKIFGYDMTPYFTLHDNRWDSARDLMDMRDILATEMVSFLAGLGSTKDNIHIALQILYSSATLSVGLSTAVANSLSELWD